MYFYQNRVGKAHAHDQFRLARLAEGRRIMQMLRTGRIISLLAQSILALRGFVPDAC